MHLPHRALRRILHVPALRDRDGDLPILSEAIFGRLGQAMHRGAPKLGPDALAALDAYAFPGNVRELENILERAITVADGDAITAGDLRLPGGSGIPSPARAVPMPGATPSAGSGANPSSHNPRETASSALSSYIEEIERRYPAGAAGEPVQQDEGGGTGDHVQGIAVQAEEAWDRLRGGMRRLSRRDRSSRIRGCRTIPRSGEEFMVSGADIERPCWNYRSRLGEGFVEIDSATSCLIACQQGNDFYGPHFSKRTCSSWCGKKSPIARRFPGKYFCRVGRNDVPSAMLGSKSRSASTKVR